MAGETPATETPTPAADGAEVSLVDTPAEGAGEKPAPAEGDKPATESKPAGEKPAGDDAKAEGDKPEASLLDDEDEPTEGKDGQADKAKDGAPEAYERFTLPDGRELDEAAMAKAAPLLRKHGLKQESAQELVTLYDELMQEAGAAQVAQHQSLIKEWTKAVKADPEFGGENLAKSRGLVRHAIAKFGGDAESQKQLLAMMGTDSSKGGWGIGNHPLIFGLLARAAAATSPDTTVLGDASTRPTPKSMAQRIYPNMPGDNQ